MRRMRRTGVLIAGLALLAAGCGGGGGGGAGDEGGPIVIGGVFDLTGATADVGKAYAEGIREYVNYVNDQGGIGGREVRLRGQDYAYQVDRAERLYSQFAGEGAVGVIGWGTADTEALRGAVNRDERPFISASFSENLADPTDTPYNFFPGPSYSDQMRIALKWVAEQEGGDRAEVAVFHHDSPFGRSPVADGQAYIEENDLNIGYRTYVMAAGVPDYIGELGRARAQGAKYIIVQNVPSPASQLLSNVRAQGMDVQFICLNYCGDELLVELAGGAAEGAIGVMPFGPPGAPTSELGEITEHLEATGRTLDDRAFFPPLRFVQGWHTARAFLEGFRLALADDDDLTGENIKDGLESVRNLETGVGPAITWTEDNHSGMDGAALYQVQDGAWARLTDVLTP